MSDENTTEANEGNEAKKVREPKKNSIPATRVKELTDGVEQYEKASFTVVGHRNGVRLAVPRTGGISRVYFYANNDYSIIPQDEAIKVFSEEQRKEQRKGGIMAEVDFTLGVEAAERALGLLVDVVKAAPAPAPKPKRERKVQQTPDEATASIAEEAAPSEEA